jgi:monoamine oxidase
LPLGLADKLFMAVEVPELLPMDGNLIGKSNKTATGYHLRPFGRPLIEGFFGGRLAHELEAAGPGALFDFAVAELVELFGNGIRARLRPLVETGWARDPFARGSYSYALPGHADARGTLAAPVDGRLFCRRSLLAARFHDGARRLSDRYRSRRQNDCAETPRDLTLDGVLAPPRVPGPFS